MIFASPDIIRLLPFPHPSPPPPIIPIDPEIRSLRDGLVNYIQKSQDSDMIGASLKSAANLFVVDSSRSTPVYKDLESQKRAIRAIGDLTLGLGFHMDDRYPGLAVFLANYFEPAQSTQEVTSKLEKASAAFSIL